MFGTQRALMNSRLMGTKVMLPPESSDEPNSESSQIKTSAQFPADICPTLLTFFEIQSPFRPLNIEVGGECDAVVLSIDPEHLIDVNADTDNIWLI